MIEALSKDNLQHFVKMQETIQSFGVNSIDKKPDYFYTHNFKVNFAKLVEGGFVVAVDVFNNILVLDS